MKSSLFVLVTLVTVLLVLGCERRSPKSCARRLAGLWYEVSRTRDGKEGETTGTTFYDVEKMVMYDPGYTAAAPRPFEIVRCSEDRLVYQKKDGRTREIVFHDEDNLSVVFADGDRIGKVRHRPGCLQDKLTQSYVPQPYEDVEAKKRKTLASSCEAGDGESCDDLAQMWKDGEGGRRDHRLALELREKAVRNFVVSCRAGNPESCRELFWKHELGNGVVADPVKARAYFEKVMELFEAGCTAEEASSCLSLGHLLDDIPGAVDNPMEKAGRYFERACDLGAPKGCRALATNLIEREGCGERREPISEAMRRARQGATLRCRQGDAGSCLSVADDSMSGEGGPRSSAEASDLLEKACELGGPISCLKAAERAADGPEELGKLAPGFLRRACEGGLAKACRRLGDFWKTGSPDIFAYFMSRIESGFGTVDMVKARHYYRLACDGGDAEGCYRASDISEYGDRTASRAFMARACELERYLACESLGDMWRDGEGGPKDEAKAREFCDAELASYEAACDAGDAGDCRRLAKAWYEGKITKAIDLARSNELFGRARDIYEAECRGQDAWGCGQLAEMWEEGEGVTKSESRAGEYHAMSLKIFAARCDEGDLDSCEEAIEILDEGVGGARDPVKVAAYYSRLIESYRCGCDGGRAWDCKRLAEAHEEGKGVPVDLARARELRAKACELGHGRSCP